tara:strand:+ start:1498 stop:2592 length:1095 start_codon:yes stop_codon:yes gene_type:complete
MLEFVKQLFETNVISEEVKSEIETAWETTVQENRDNVTTQLREEYAQKYEHDKTAMVEAVENMLADRIQAELSEFAEDRQGLIEAKAKYAEKIVKDSKAMEAFVLKNLKNELAELREDRKAVAGNVGKLESFIVDALSKEIAEFHADKKDLAETKVKLVRDSKVKFEAARKDFINKASKVIEETVSKGIKSEMVQLKEDIQAARENDFGRRLFESFASEYATSHLNEKSETSKLLKVVKQKDAEVKEAAVIVAESKKLVESRDAEIARIKNSAARTEVMAELLGPLSAEKREVMGELLESVQTTKLHTAFDKYISSVMEGGAPKKAALTEGKEITGNRSSGNQISSGEKTAEIFDIRRLAGLKV